jgi:hypothetical protein
MGDAVIPVKVATRVRPLSEMELGNGCMDIIDVIPGRPQVAIRNSDKSFTFDYAFGQVISPFHLSVNFSFTFIPEGQLSSNYEVNTQD